MGSDRLKNAGWSKRLLMVWNFICYFFLDSHQKFYCFNEIFTYLCTYKLTMNISHALSWDHLLVKTTRTNEFPRSPTTNMNTQMNSDMSLRIWGLVWGLLVVLVKLLVQLLIKSLVKLLLKVLLKLLVKQGTIVAFNIVSSTPASEVPFDLPLIPK